jgi:tRNA threonylcarbamoyladenosine modification (KEOPS) complex  Pcc1 subunit|tara:strand:+ start:997 stop:1152 length:156 start_codon:yes stop_codon:yes gene_type:complete
MVTEADFTLTGQMMEFTLSSQSISDIRARWNSLLRGIVASEQALKAIRESR